MFTCGLLRWNDSLAMVVVVLLETVEIYRVTLELAGGFEPPTSSLPRMRSTPELREQAVMFYSPLDETKTPRPISIGETRRGTPDLLWGRAAGP